MTQEQTSTLRFLVKACKVAQLEFERISYQIKANQDVLDVLSKAIKAGETQLPPGSCTLNLKS
jgi:hypothetical protein